MLNSFDELQRKEHDIKRKKSQENGSNTSYTNPHPDEDIIASFRRRSSID
jgi:hypothetical protein